MQIKNGSYGKELILDLHGCDISLFNRDIIDQYFSELCDLIDMQKCERYWWDDVGVLPEEQQRLSHTKGTSAVQFLLTSSIVIHTLDILGSAYINIFSCKDFDEYVAQDFTKQFFKARETVIHLIERTGSG